MALHLQESSHNIKTLKTGNYQISTSYLQVYMTKKVDAEWSCLLLIAHFHYGEKPWCQGKSLWGLTGAMAQMASAPSFSGFEAGY